MFTSTFWKAATERAVKTFAQSLIALIGIDKTTMIEVDWVGALSAAGLATLISVLTSLTSGAKDGNPSATNSEVARPKVGPAGPGQAPTVDPALLAALVPAVLATAASVPAPTTGLPMLAGALGASVVAPEDALEPELDTEFGGGLEEFDDDLATDLAADLGVAIDPLAVDVPEPEGFDDGALVAAGAHLSRPHQM